MIKQKQILNLCDQVNQFKLDPESFLSNHFSDLANKIDLKREVSLLIRIWNNKYQGQTVDLSVKVLCKFFGRIDLKHPNKDFNQPSIDSKTKHVTGRIKRIDCVRFLYI
ncbi:hypothetical protein BpHYR1_039563 [Brachionus plicatilis]|uniref:Uncharacterized protein n=1 Tax=Brachionus plicatilis TaxID=10195 RepID=A0A3M7QTE7_BRAPC|nr:hypothetical protein BpHYR1_039563 [Brachionus plicatilis]